MPTQLGSSSSKTPPAPPACSGVHNGDDHPPSTLTVTTTTNLNNDTSTPPMPTSDQPLECHERIHSSTSSQYQFSGETRHGWCPWALWCSGILEQVAVKRYETDFLQLQHGLTH